MGEKTRGLTKKKLCSYTETTTLNCLEKMCYWPWEVPAIYHDMCWLALWSDIHLVCVSCNGNWSSYWLKHNETLRLCTDQVHPPPPPNVQLWPPGRTGSPVGLWCMYQTRRACEVHICVLTWQLLHPVAELIYECVLLFFVKPSLLSNLADSERVFAEKTCTLEYRHIHGWELQNGCPLFEVSVSPEVWPFTLALWVRLSTPWAWLIH